MAAADYDNDGDIDLFVSHLERPVALLRNDTQPDATSSASTYVQLNRIPPIGGCVVVASGKYRRSMPVQAGGSYLSSSDGRLLFGLADEPGPVAVQIFWPSGRVQQV